MIKSIIIENFQAHEKTVIELSPNVTAIIGLNNHGKSSIFRAFQKVIRDIPEGNTFITKGKESCSITLVNDFTTITRKVKSNQSSDSNVYIVGKTEFVKFGKTGIPEEVINSLEVSPIQSFGDIEYDLNFQHQLDPLFLITGTGLSSIRGKVLSKITGVDICQRGVQYVAGEIKKLNQEIKRNDIAKQQLQQKIETFEKFNFDYINNSIKEIEIKLDKSNNIIKDISTLEESISFLQKISSQAKITKKIIKSLDIDLSSSLETLSNIFSAIDLLNNIQYIIENQQKCEKISKINLPDLEEIINIRESITNLESILSELNTLTFNFNRAVSLSEISIPSNILDLENIKKVLDELYNIQYILEELSNNIKTKELVFSVREDELESANLELQKLKINLKVCPVCQRPF